jgi:hypothetical protein
VHSYPYSHIDANINSHSNAKSYSNTETSPKSATSPYAAVKETVIGDQ